MKMTVTAPALALACLLALAGAACGGDDDGDGGGEDTGGEAGGGDRGEYVAALVSTMENDDEFPEGSRECVAGALIDAVGFDQLAEAVTPDEIREQGSSFDPAESGIELTDEQGQVYYEALNGCMDVRQLLADAIAEDLDEEAAACVADALSDDVARVFVVTSFTGEDPATAEPELMEEFQTAVTPCLSAE
jgi:hypothetical protein